MRCRSHILHSTEEGPRFDFVFSTLDELLTHPNIAAWSADNYKGTGPFFRYSVCFINPIRRLMVEYNEGKSWWVVAYLEDGANGLALPRWVPNDNP